MFRFACMDVLKNYQNSYNSYSINKPSIAFPLLKNYCYTDYNKDYKFKQKVFSNTSDEKKKWNKDFSKFTYFKHIKNYDTKDDNDDNDDNNFPKNNLAAFVIITLFTGAGIYLFRRSIFPQK